MRILKTCEYCKNEFIAKTTVTQCCSDTCAKRFYKLKKRNGKMIAQAELKSDLKRKPKAYMPVDEIIAVQAKKHLTLKEAAFLLNISPLTLRRWTLAGKVTSQKIGKKHMFLKETCYKCLI